jgi:hypothetical protein
VKGNESIAELGAIFNENVSTWQNLGILLPSATPSNRARKRNDHGWCYVAQQWEKLMSLRKRAEQSNTSVEDLLKVSNEKERLHQKSIGAKRSQKQREEGGSISSSSEQRPQRVRRIEAGEIGVTTSVADRLDNLL